MLTTCRQTSPCCEPPACSYSTPIHRIVLHLSMPHLISCQPTPLMLHINEELVPRRASACTDQCLLKTFPRCCSDSDSAPSTPRSVSTSAASSPLRAAPFEAAPRLRFSDDGARRQHWGHSASDPGHRELFPSLSAAAIGHYFCRGDIASRQEGGLILLAYTGCEVPGRLQCLCCSTTSTAPLLLPFPLRLEVAKDPEEVLQAMSVVDATAQGGAPARRARAAEGRCLGCRP